jgi:opacity protein-like surface antigen
MKLKILILVMTSICLNLYGQNENTKDLRLGLLLTLDDNRSPENFRYEDYIGYSVDYNKTSYRIGLSVEYFIKNRLSINSGLNYSNKDFTGTYYCAVCDIIGPIYPETIELRFIEIPLSFRYYFFPNKLRLFTDLGINNQFVLTKDKIDKSYTLGLKFGGGIEYNLNQNLSIELMTEYLKGITNLLDASNFKVDYLSLGIGIQKRL